VDALELAPRHIAAAELGRAAVRLRAPADDSARLLPQRRNRIEPNLVPLGP
jgi:hypothetical protein